MPRLSRALIRQAALQNPLLPYLLRVCRDLPSARNELRWLQGHSRHTVAAKNHNSPDPVSPPADTKSCHLDTAHRAFGLRKDRPVSPRTATKSGPSNWDQSRADNTKNADDNGEASTTREAHREKISDRYRSLGQILPSANSGRDHLDESPQKKNNRRFSRKRGSSTTASVESVEILPQSGFERDTLVRSVLVKSVVERSRGKPLQYVIGNQPFGNLDILCRQGVLIPRPETETYTEALGGLLLSHGSAKRADPTKTGGKIRILDLCSGSGCIALLLHSILKPPEGRLHTAPRSESQDMDIDIIGVDNRKTTINLARQNLQHNISKGLLHRDAVKDVLFTKLDILHLANRVDHNAGNNEVLEELNATVSFHKKEPELNLKADWDVIISNPPYISPKDYDIGGRTEPSVRKYEPKSALVPPHEDSLVASMLGDSFYEPLMRMAHAVGAKILLMEVGDSKQAGRVYEEAVRNFVHEAASNDSEVHFECWRDDGSVRVLPKQPPPNFDFAAGVNPEFSDRAVVVWTGVMAKWRRDEVMVSP